MKAVGLVIVFCCTVVVLSHDSRLVSPAPAHAAGRHPVPLRSHVPRLRRRRLPFRRTQHLRLHGC